MVKRLIVRLFGMFQVNLCIYVTIVVYNDDRLVLSITKQETRTFV